MIKIDGVDPKMIANNLIPFEPTHPGEVLKDEIEFRGISQKKLAKEMGVSYTVLNEILNAKRSLNTKCYAPRSRVRFRCGTFAQNANIL